VSNGWQVFCFGICTQCLWKWKKHATQSLLQHLLLNSAAKDATATEKQLPMSHVLVGSLTRGTMLGTLPWEHCLKFEAFVKPYLGTVLENLTRKRSFGALRGLCWALPVNLGGTFFEPGLGLLQV